MSKAASSKKKKLVQVVEDAVEQISLRPQEGPQESFLSTSADIAIYGGSAFSGKTFALLLEPLRHIGNKFFSAVCFRRETPQIRNPGGLWDESMGLYPQFGAAPHESVLEYDFPSGAKVKFSHLEHTTSVTAWDGAQVPLIMFDQLEHFERSQFFYMLSRNRDPSGTVRPYIRATCNPNADSWLAEFISWWINEDTGYPIPERAGRIRWFMREGDVIVWGDSRDELVEQFGASALTDAKSVTFIPGTIYDNKIGMRKDPSYLGSLKAMAKVERERLLGDPELGGNWKIRPAAGLMFRREWCHALEAVPADLESVVRYWDLAATEATENNDPAWTVGVKLGRYRRSSFQMTPRYVILDVRRARVSSHKVKTMLRNTAEGDGHTVRVGFPQDPGQAGKTQVADIVGLLAGFDSRSEIESGDKVVRFNPFSAQCEAGNVDYVVGPWNEVYLSSLENFPDGKVKDDADASSGAFKELMRYGGLVDVSKGAEVGESSSADHSDAPWNVNG